MPRPRGFLIAGFLLACIATVEVGGAPGDTPPTLTDVQRLTVQTLALRIENAQLRAQAAQRDFDEARKELTATVKALEVPGYTFDWQALTYQPVATEGGR